MSLRRNWSRKPASVLVTPWHLFGRDSRVITLFGEISSSLEIPVLTTESIPFLAEEVFGSLMLLAQEGKDPVRIIINNRGGYVSAGLIIVQAMEHLQALGIDVEILVLGSSMSMASIVLAAGTVGKRYALQRSTIHFHSGKAASGGTPEEKERIDEHIRRITAQLHLVLAKRTKIPEYCFQNEFSDDKGASMAVPSRDAFDSEEKRIKWVKKFLEKENFLSPEEAQKAGIVDEVLKSGDPRICDIFRLNLNSQGGAK